MATPFAPHLIIRDLARNVVLADTHTLLDWSISRKLDAATVVLLEVAYGTAEAAAFLAAETSGGILADLSLGGWRGGGEERDVRRILERPTRHLLARTPTLVDEGEDIWAGYSATGLDRVSWRLTPIQDILYGAAGTIKPPNILDAAGAREVDNDTGLILGQDEPLKNVKGAFLTAPGSPLWEPGGRALITMVPFIDPMLSFFDDPRFATPGLRISVDIWADYLAQALKLICEKVGGVLFDGDQAEQGARGHFVPDSSSAGLNLTGMDNGIAIGKAGNYAGRPILNFVQKADNDAPPDLDTAVIEEMTITPELGDLYAQAEFIGGQSNHGLPDGAKITGVIVLNKGRGAGGGGQYTSLPDWDASLLAVGAYASSQVGGVYYHPGDGVFHALGQSLGGVNDIAYWEPSGTLVVATDGGVYSHSADPLDSSPWGLLGGFGGKVAKLRLVAANDDPDFNGFAVWALSSGNGAGLDGILRYPGINGDASSNLGHDGWTRMYAQSGIADFAPFDDFSMGYVDSNRKAGVVLVRRLPGTGGQIFFLYAPTTNGETVEGLDECIGFNQIFVRTANGSQGLYICVPDSSSLFPQDSGGALSNPSDPTGGHQGTMLGADGRPVHVNRIVTVDQTINKRYVGLLACTDQGLFQNNVVAGTYGRWSRCDGQSGMGNANLRFAATGREITLLDRERVVRVFAGGEGELYVSNSGGVYWYDILKAPLDLGPFWYALAASKELEDPIGAPYPNNLIIALGDETGHGAIDPEPDKTRVLQIKAAQPHSLPQGYRVDRRLDEQNNWTYRFVNMLSPAPYFAIMFQAVSEIATSSQVPVREASEQLALVTFRWLSQHSVPQTFATINSTASDAHHALRSLRPSDSVNVSCTVRYPRRLDPNDYGSPIDSANSAAVLYNLEPFYVLEHDVRKGIGPEAVCQTKLGRFLLNQKNTPAQLVAGLLYGLKTVQRKAP